MKSSYGAISSNSLPQLNIGCVLMAAGQSVRFGENKLLHSIEGSSLIARAVQAAPSCLFARAVAVVSDAEVARVAQEAGYTVVWNHDSIHGQGTTVSLGAAAMEGMDAALFCVGDQPYLRVETVQQLLAAYEPGTICALAYGGKRGNPILFPAVCLSELAALAPEQTGRAVLARHPDLLRMVEAQSARELFDIDTQEDLKR